MTISEAAARYGVCLGACGIPAAAHWKGVIDPFETVHFADRRFSRRALRNLLLLVARIEREVDPRYLNRREYEYFYLYVDNVAASRMALDLGVRLPARLSRLDRLRCLQLARKHKARLSKRGALYAWANDHD